MKFSSLDGAVQEDDRKYWQFRLNIKKKHYETYNDRNSF